MKLSKTLLAGSILAASSVATTAVYAGSALTGNFAATSNYIWRGKTQTNDQAAVQGGVDYDFGHGVTAGAWISNVDFGSDTTNDTGTELDLYASWSTEFGPVGFEVGAINYRYPSQENINFTEAFVNVGLTPADKISLDFSANFTINSDAGGQDSDVYLSASFGYEINKDMSFGVTYGDYNYDAAGTEDYSHWQASLSKGDFTFAIDKNDSKSTDTNSRADDTRISISWGQEFDL